MKKLLAFYMDILPQLIVKVGENYALFRVQCCR